MSETGEKLFLCFKTSTKTDVMGAPLKRQFKRAPKTPVSAQRREEQRREEYTDFNTTSFGQLNCLALNFHFEFMMIYSLIWCSEFYY